MRSFNRDPDDLLIFTIVDRQTDRLSAITWETSGTYQTQNKHRQTDRQTNEHTQTDKDTLIQCSYLRARTSGTGLDIPDSSRHDRINDVASIPTLPFSTLHSLILAWNNTTYSTFTASSRRHTIDKISHLWPPIIFCHLTCKISQFYLSVLTISTYY